MEAGDGEDMSGFNPDGVLPLPVDAYPIDDMYKPALHASVEIILDEIRALRQAFEDRFAKLRDDLIVDATALVKATRVTATKPKVKRNKPRLSSSHRSRKRGRHKKAKSR